MRKIIVAASIIVIGAFAFAAYSYLENRNTNPPVIGIESKQEVALTFHKPAQESKLDSINDRLYNIAFYRNQDLFSVQFKNGKVGKPSPLSAENYDVEKNARYFTTSLMPKEVLNAIPISPNMIFYSGLQSNSKNSEWLFVERDMQSTAYNLCTYSNDSKAKTILFNQSNSPDKKYAFKPIAWLANSPTVYLEALVFGSSTENEGIWEYNLSSKTATRVNISANYSNTPQISADGRYFLYCATTTQKDIHALPKQVLVFDIDAKKEVVIAEDVKASFVMADWLKASEKAKMK